MRKRLIVLCTVLAVICFAVLLHSPTRCKLFGLIRGEPFCDGKPASYWKLSIRDWLRPSKPPSPSLLGRVRKSLDLEAPRAERMLLARLDALPVLLWLLQDEDVEVRRIAARALGRNGRFAAAAVPGLIKALEDEDSGVRVAAALSLGDIGQDAKAAVPLLVKRLQHEGNIDYIRALGAIGPCAKEAEPVLLALMRRKGNKNVSPSLRADVQAATALRQIDRDNVEVRSFFRSLLEDLEQGQEWTPEIHMLRAELRARDPDREK